MKLGSIMVTRSTILNLFMSLALVLSCFNDCTNAKLVPRNERDILIDLFKSTEGRGWTTNYGWLSPTSFCSWFGVKCNDTQTIVELDLGSNQLSGTIPSSLGELANLRYLYLGNNQLSGTIPPPLGQLSNLVHLNLYNNQLSGTIPSSLGRLNILEVLNLGYNQLSGVIPSPLGQLTSLQYLNLGNNQLSGTIPSSLGQLQNLLHLYAGSNQLSGTIPSSLHQLYNLLHLYLDNNQFRGISSGFTRPKSLLYCGMQNNPLRCQIPEWTQSLCFADCT